MNWVDPWGLSASEKQQTQGNQSQWINNGDGTYTAQKGATLWGLYGKNWKSKSGYTGNPENLQPGDIVGMKLCDIKQNSSSRGVDLNFFPTTGKDASLHNWANLVENPDHTFVIGGHGSTKVFQDKNGKNIDPEALAGLIKDNPNYEKGDTIRLLSCNAGGKTKGYDNYAQRLADVMVHGTKVYGPTEFCWYSSDGSIEIAGKSWFFKDQPATILKRGKLECFIGR